LGHQRIGAIVGCGLEGMQLGRLDGFKSALSAAGITLAEPMVRNVRDTVAGGHEATDSLLEQHPDITAIFCTNDLMAYGASQALADLIPVAPPAEMFTIGLLADIGRLALASARPKRYGEILRGVGTGAPAAALRQEEKQAFSFDHLELAAAMMQDWLFPKLFCETVLHHKAADATGLDEEDRQQRLIRLLELAACVADICVADDATRAALLPHLLQQGQRFELPSSSLEYLCARVSWDWSEWGAMLKIPTRVLRELGSALAAATEQPG
jgi:hypothetical protein